MIYLLILFIILACLFFVCTYLFKNRFIHRISLILFVISFIGLFSLEYRYFKTENMPVNSASNNKYYKLLSPDQAISFLKQQYGDLLKTAKISPVNIKCVQLDNDPDYEMVVLFNADHFEYNFFVADYNNGKWEFVLKEKDIQDYYTVNNNSLLVLTTNTFGIGTGMSQANYLIYSKINDKYVLAWNEIEQSKFAKFDTDMVYDTTSNIEFVGDKLVYTYWESATQESYKSLKSKENKCEYTLKNGIFEQIK